MATLLERLNVEGATDAHLNKALAEIGRTAAQFPEGENLGPLGVALARVAKGSALAAPAKGAVVNKVKPVVSAEAPAVAPVVSAPTVVLTSAGEFDWDGSTDEECSAEMARLKLAAARAAMRAEAAGIKRGVAEFKAATFDQESQTIELEQQGLSATQEVVRQRTAFDLQKQAEGELTAMAVAVATEIAQDAIDKSKAALDLGKSIALDTPVPAQVATYRLLNRQAKVANEITAIKNNTPALLSAQSIATEKSAATIDV